MIAFIPSKGRPQTKTHELFEASGFDVYHFVEPQDLDSYNVTNVVSILKDNMGMTYVRNFMLQYAKDNGISHHVVCDDDMNSFGEAKNGRAVKCDNADSIAKYLKIFTKSGFSIGGLNNRQYAWAEKKSYKVNTGKAEGCFFLNADKINWQYKEDTKEDRDFLLQCLDNRRNFVFFCKLFFNCPVIGTNKGGLFEKYAEKRDSLWAMKLNADWPNYTKIIKQHGRVDCKIDYKKKSIDMGLAVI